MGYTVTIDKFEGPLDLLLALIKEQDVDIFDINIADITSQYLNYISQMESLDLNIDSEYLVMAADLIELKSKELLPQEVTEEIEEDDPKAMLINRLLEYQKYKEASYNFKELETMRSQLFSKAPSLLAEFKDDTLKITEDISLDDLIKAFANFKARKIMEQPLKTVVTKKEYSVHKRSQEIMRRLATKPELDFDELFEVFAKDYIVVTFLSILDLAKKGQIEIKQNHNLDKITLRAKECNL